MVYRGGKDTGGTRVYVVNIVYDTGGTRASSTTISGRREAMASRMRAQRAVQSTLTAWFRRADGVAHALMIGPMSSPAARARETASASSAADAYAGAVPSPSCAGEHARRDWEWRVGWGCDDGRAEGLAWSRGGAVAVAAARWRRRGGGGGGGGGAAAAHEYSVDDKPVVGQPVRENVPL